MNGRSRVMADVRGDLYVWGKTGHGGGGAKFVGGGVADLCEGVFRLCP